MKDNKGSMIILTVIGIATLLIAVIGATFAYFTATIDYKNTPSTVVVQSNTMIVEFDTLNELNYIGAVPGRPEPNYDLFKDNKLKFSLTSHQNLVSPTEYDVYLVIDKNEFIKSTNSNSTDELVYVTTAPSTSINTRTVSKAAQENKSIGEDGEANYNNTVNGVEYKPETLTVTRKDATTNIETKEEVVVGLIPSNISYPDNLLEEEKIRIKIGSGILASHGSVDTWQVEVWLKELHDEQNYNQGKNLKAHIDIVVTGNSYATNEIVTTKVTP